MSEQEKQKIKKDFEERFPNADSEVKSYGEYCALRDWLLETIDKTIKSKLEAVEEEITTATPSWHERTDGRDNSYDDAFEDGGEVAIRKVLDIINKHK